MTVESCEAIFNSILDNDISTVGVLFPILKTDDEVILDCLDRLACRLQIEFGKEVIFLSSENIDCEIEHYSKESDPHVLIPKFADNKYVFICLFKSSYFKQDDTWYMEIMNMLTYYKKQFFGFSDRDARICAF